MENTEIRVALKHHFGWQVYAVLAATLAEAAYKAVRESHEFLTDTNHTHTEGPQTMKWGSSTLDWNSVVILKNESSPGFLLAPGWVQDGPGALWFSVEYRAAHPGEVNPPWMTKREHSKSAALAAA